LTIADFEDIGDSLRHAIVELVGLHPNSKIPETIYESADNIKTEIMNQLIVERAEQEEKKLK